MGYKYKIGQQIEFISNHTIETSKGKKLTIVKGDKAMVVKKIDNNTGEIVYTTGEARGFSDKLNIEVEDNIDVDEIAKRILSEI